MSLVTDNAIIEQVMDGNAFRAGQEVTVTAAATKQLVLTSPMVQTFTTGVGGQIVKLPDATTLKNGHMFWVHNACITFITMQDFDANELLIANQSSRVLWVLRDNGTTAGVWDRLVGSASAFQGTSPVISSYNGNANTGRYLEWFSGTDSLESPFIIPTDSIIVALTLGAAAAGTGTVGIFVSTDLVTPVESISLTASKQTVLLNLSANLSVSDAIVIRVTAGSIQKPHCVVYLAGV